MPTSLCLRRREPITSVLSRIDEFANVGRSAVRIISTLARAVVLIAIQHAIWSEDFAIRTVCITTGDRIYRIRLAIDIRSLNQTVDEPSTIKGQCRNVPRVWETARC